jgi:hypothetical protein
MVLRGQIQGFVYKGIPEIRASQLQTNFEPCTAQPILIRIVHIEHEVERAALQAESCDVDLLQRDLWLLEIDRVAERRASRDAQNEYGQTASAFTHNR